MGKLPLIQNMFGHELAALCLHQEEPECNPHTKTAQIEISENGSPNWNFKQWQAELKF